MNSKSLFKKLIAAFLAFVVLVVIVVNGVLIWVATGPRTLEAATPYIEKALTPDKASYKVRIGETVLLWDGWRRPIDMRIKKVEMLTLDGQVFASFPEISVGLSIPSMLIGRLSLSNLAIKNPVVSLYQQQDGVVGFGFGGTGSSTVSIADILKSLSRGSGGAGIDSIVIEDADLSLGNERKGILVEAPKINVRVIRQGDTLNALVEINAQYKAEKSTLTADVRWEQNQEIVKGKVSFTNLLPAMISEFLPPNVWLDGIHVPLNGAADLAVNTKGEWQSLNFDIKSGEGTLAHAGKFPKPLVVKSLMASGGIEEHGSRIVIHNVLIQFDKPSLELKGEIGQREHDGLMLLNVTAKDMPIDELYKYWPVDLYPVSRDWVTKNITVGTVPLATAEVALRKGDVAEDGSIPEGAFSAAVHVKGADVEYLSGFPKVKNVDGVAKFSGKGMFIDLAAGTMSSGTQLKGGKIVIADLFPAEPIIDIALDVYSPARDVIGFIDLLKLEMAKTLALDASKAGGGAEGKIHLNFPLLQNDIPDDQLFNHVKYDIAADLKSALQGGFMKILDIAGANGRLGVDNKKITLVGNAAVNGVDVAIDLLTNFNENGKLANTRYTVKAPNVPVEALPRFGYKAVPGISGSLAIEAEVDETGKERNTKAKVDLLNAAVEVAAINYKKAPGTPANLALEGKESGSLALIKSFNYQSDALKAAGSAALKADLSDVSQFNLATLKHGKNDFALSYQSGAIDKIQLRGRMIDLSGYFGGKSKFSTKDYASLDLKLEMETMILAGGAQASNMAGTLTCDKERCNSANISAQLSGNKPFAYRIFNEGGKRKLLLTAEDAGLFVSAFNVNHNIAGGKLKVDGTFDDDKPSRPLQGKLLIKDYHLAKAPVLANILTIASLSGALNTLTGQGIAFTKMSVPFTLENDMLKIKDGKAYGDALGITVDGDLSVSGDMVDVKGTLVPAYSLNSIFGKLPIVGVLAGGAGQGLFAANYSVKGSYDQPNISVNPLSILTPGFLRGLFDIADAPADKAPDAKEEVKEAPKEESTKEATPPAQ